MIVLVNISIYMIFSCAPKAVTIRANEPSIFFFDNDEVGRGRYVTVTPPSKKRTIEVRAKSEGYKTKIDYLNPPYGGKTINFLFMVSDRLDGLSSWGEPVNKNIQQSSERLNIDVKTKSSTSTIESKKDIYPLKSHQSIKAIGEYWAVIIGISKYTDNRIPSLRYASKDAESFYNWIISSEGGKYAHSRVKLLLDRDATYENIKDALFEWSKQILEEDVVTIYFAGHGSPESPDSPDNLFLLPYDTNYSKIASTGFPMWDIETALKRFIKAKKVIVIADACHSGGVGQLI